MSRCKPFTGNASPSGWTMPTYGKYPSHRTPRYLTCWDALTEATLGLCRLAAASRPAEWLSDRVNLPLHNYQCDGAGQSWPKKFAKLEDWGQQAPGKPRAR